ncbi:hypothetical protein [Brevibacterium linens]|uniref:hypothetical protein n=1 Tax=Brevibacterium linens TaxID=1703 RepID=UPI003BF5FBDE
MLIYERPFIEKPENVRAHERITHHIRIAPAQRANGNPAIYLEVNHRRAVLDPVKAIELANELVDMVERVQK